MILNLKLIGEREIPVKAHRVLTKVFPELELYVHYAIKEHDGEFSIDKGIYHISTKNGFRIPNVFSTNELVVLMTRTIHFIQSYGIEKMILKENQALVNFELKKEFPGDFISGLDTAITPETNIETLHAKIKYLSRQLEFRKSELKKNAEKFDQIKEKFEEIIYDYDTFGTISSADRRRFYEILGVNE